MVSSVRWAILFLFVMHIVTYVLVDQAIQDLASFINGTSRAASLNTKLWRALSDVRMLQAIDAGLDIVQYEAVNAELVLLAGELDDLHRNVYLGHGLVAKKYQPLTDLFSKERIPISEYWRFRA